jgi:uncharacterized damage-inducible protein DinB
VRLFHLLAPVCSLWFAGECERYQMTCDQFRELAAYNRWANARLYAAAIALPDAVYRQPVGVFFGSLHGTLNHLLLTDRLWLKRLTGRGEHPNKLDTILYEDRTDLTRARLIEDDRLITVVGGYDDDSRKPLLIPDSIGGSTAAGALRDSAALVQSPDAPSWPSPCVLLDPHRLRAAPTRPADVPARIGCARSRKPDLRTAGAGA